MFHETYVSMLFLTEKDFSHVGKLTDKKLLLALFYKDLEILRRSDIV